MDKLELKNLTDIKENTNLKELDVKDSEIKVKFTRGMIFFALGVAFASLIVGVLLNLSPLFIVQGTLFSTILAYISILDIKLHLCPDWSHFAIAGISLIGIIYALINKNYFWLVSCGLGFIFVPLSLIICNFVSKGDNQVGGADIKLCAATALVLGVKKEYIALIVALVLALVIEGIRRIINKSDNKTPFPFIPYFSVGLAVLFYL